MIVESLEVSNIRNHDLVYRFDEISAVKMSMLVLWVVTPSGLAVRYQRFGEAYCL
jgi:hypothetical protein